MGRKIWLFLALLVLVLPVTGLASEEKGSIRLTMHYGSGVISGGSVTLYDISDWNEMKDPEALAKDAATLELPGETRKVGADGCVSFLDLTPGQYLLAQKEAAEGFLPMRPFCVSLPMSVDGALIYDIDATPKLEIAPGDKLPQTGQLVWPAWVLLWTGICLVGAGILTGKRK